MEDGSDDVKSSAAIASLSPICAALDESTMANFPNCDSDTVVAAAATASKVNGDVDHLHIDSSAPVSPQKDESSDCDALFIDEGTNPPQVKKPKLSLPPGGQDDFPHSNPYFAESIFELSKEYNKPVITKQQEKGKKSGKINGKKLRGKNGKPKLREYAQYLGLQPSVQFKCSKCGCSGFQTLQSLNEHLTTCTSTSLQHAPQPLASNTTNFRVTRKVFLCSACGTYYENWNLFLHMREVHKRFICLYCLGMFPQAEKLSHHLITRHELSPNRFNTSKEFFDSYKDPCFLMCCDCQSVFNEQEDFVNHACVEKEPNSDSAQPSPPQVEPDEQVMAPAPPAEISEPVEVENKLKEEPEEEEEEEENPPSPPNNDLFKENNQDSDCHSEVNANENESAVQVKEEVEAEEVEEDDVDEEEEDSRETPVEEDDEEEEEEHKNQLPEPADVEQPANAEKDDDDDEGLRIDEPEKEDEEDTDEKVVRDNRVPNNEESNTLDSSEDMRKVPKVTLKLPKVLYDPTSHLDEEEEDEYDDEEDEEEYHSEESEKHAMETEIKSEGEEMENENGFEEEDCRAVIEEEESRSDVKEEVEEKWEDSLPTAGPDISVIELELEQPLDKFNIKPLLQKCLVATIPICLYCNHARKIAVNGKQLGLHAIAEHRYAAVVKSITAEELIPESFNARIKESLDELESMYFNLESSTSEGGVTYSHAFECFQCRYSAQTHKELYLHNRKLHTKAVLLCVMCKTSFYSYSELICHLCPGIYMLQHDVQFRCCLCVSDDLPSAFRLMVHLRKKHHVCDVCLDMCHTQSRLSNHIWKHKLHHLCYRCGIAYRNKPDITKHLFWKHGTESVTCRRCLNKKWPHMYHFCTPPPSFQCEECNLTFSRAVNLMVHKRFHADVFPHACSEEGCSEKFVSKKLLQKHESKHRQPVEEPNPAEEPKPDENRTEATVVSTESEQPDTIATSDEPPAEEKPPDKPKPKVDLFDLPELNLSESDSSESEDESSKPAPTTTASNSPQPLDAILESSTLQGNELPKLENPISDTKPDTVPVLENVWDDFKNYQAEMASKVDILTEVGKFDADDDVPPILTDVETIPFEVLLRDHDYCLRTSDTLKEEDELPPEPAELGPDHDYCTGDKREQKPEPTENAKVAPERPAEAKRPNHAAKRQGGNKSSSDSSSDSDSSGCTCGSNCSCSSSSGSSSSSSDSSESDSSSEEGRKRQQARREKRRQKKVKKAASESAPVDVVTTDKKDQVVSSLKADDPIHESDLETTESDTDEEFYDKEPQKLANKLIAEKREKLMQMAGIGPYINGSMIDSRPSTPTSLPAGVVEEEAPKPKKKSKSKKKKRKKSRHEASAHIETVAPVASAALLHSSSVISPLTLSIPRNSPIYPTYDVTMQSQSPNVVHQTSQAYMDATDSSTRVSKRRRVPNKFYGYSSDEETEKMAHVSPSIKFRKVDLPSPKSPLVPPITIKTTPAAAPTVEPISIRMNSKQGEPRIQPLRLPVPKRMAPKLKPPKPSPIAMLHALVSDSNTSSSEDEPRPPTVAPVKEQPALYCYCRCPYDEVSEMIGCDADDCAIEWFHFECVGIMVPPKGQWYCPDCRKKKQQRREMLQAQMSS